MKLSFDEIKNWAEFEDLTASYFRLQESYDIEVAQSGKGSDGGRDLLLTISYSSPIRSFEHKWVVQCKFYNRDLRNSDFADINIPSLIHEYNAEGFLLICKKGVVNTLQQKLENLEKNCKFGYAYRIWTGAAFADEIFRMKSEVVRKHYFPKYSKTQ